MLAIHYESIFAPILRIKNATRFLYGHQHKSFWKHLQNDFGIKSYAI